MTIKRNKRAKHRELAELNLVDKFLFDETMEDPEAYEAFVEILLGEDHIALSKGTETEKEIRLSPQIREIRLDVISFDEETTDIKLNDGAKRIFINTMGTNPENFSEEFLDLMKYITNSDEEVIKDSSSKRIQKIHKRVSDIRLSEKAGVRYMQKWEELAYAKQDGKEEGREEILITLICKKLRKGKSPEEISNELEEDSSVITNYCAELAEYAPEYNIEKILDDWFGEE